MPIVISRWGTYDGATLSVVGPTFFQSRRPVQLSLAGDVFVWLDWALRARAEPAEPAQLGYRGVFGLGARVCERCVRRVRLVVLAIRSA